MTKDLLIPRVEFYLMTQKGFVVLKEFIRKFGSASVAHVISAEDKQVDGDYYQAIERLCYESEITFYNRKKLPEIHGNSSLRFAIGWRWLIPESHNLIVLHDSLLPEYRGFAPVVSALINGEKQLGVTALFANKDYDEGDIINQKSIDIVYPVKIADVIQRLSSIYAEIVGEIYSDIVNNDSIQGKQQNDSDSTYSIWRDEKDYFIKWNDDAERIKRAIDALGYPYLGARALMNGEIVIIKDAEVVEDLVVENREDAIGKVVKVAEGKPIVICRKGLLKLIEVTNLNTNVDMLPLKKFRTRFE